MWSQPKRQGSLPQGFVRPSFDGRGWGMPPKNEPEPEPESTLSTALTFPAAPSSTFQLMDLISPALADSGLNQADQDELSFHLAEILADLRPLLGLLTAGAAPTPDVVHELLSQVLWHWPYHQANAKRLEARMD